MKDTDGRIPIAPKPEVGGVSHADMKRAIRSAQAEYRAQRPDRREATDDDLPGFLRVLAAWAPMHRRRLNEAADRIDYLAEQRRTEQPNSAVKAYHGGTDSAEQAPPSTEATFDVVERIKGRFRYELRDPVIKPETVEDMKILLDSHDEQQREIARLKLALHQATCKDCAAVASGCCVNYRILQGELYTNE